MHSSWQFVEQAARQYSVRVYKSTGAGKVRRRKYTGAHRFLPRTEMNSAIARLGG